MDVMIRPEKGEDYAGIREVNDLAFGQENESRLIEELRGTRDFIPGLSLVAEREGMISGHILFYPIRINGDGNKHITLSLGPMAVHPEYQRKGIGSALIKDGLKRARELGYRSVIVVGHAKYYPRFGFKRASAFGLEAPFEVPDEAFMAQELAPGALEKVRGVLEYPNVYYEAM